MKIRIELHQGSAPDMELTRRLDAALLESFGEPEKSANGLTRIETYPAIVRSQLVRISKKGPAVFESTEQTGADWLFNRIQEFGNEDARLPSYPEESTYRY